MSYEKSSGLGVSTQYGARRAGGTVGHIMTDGAYNELTLELSAENLIYGFIEPVYLPVGAYIKSALVRVSEAFVISGSGNTVSFGTKGSEAANGLTITQAQLNIIGTYDLSAALAGTWKVTAPANGSVTEVAGGVQVNVIETIGTGGVVSPLQGRAEIVIGYFHVVR